MTPIVMMSQKIASNSAASEVLFTWSMLNMLGDRLRNVPKNCQFRSPFDSKFRRPGVPLTNALALMKKIKLAIVLHRYMITILIRCKKNSYVLQPYTHIVAQPYTHILLIPLVRQVLIQHGSMLRLIGQDIVH
jgi:hypothetical protein